MPDANPLTNTPDDDLSDPMEGEEKTSNPDSADDSASLTERPFEDKPRNE